MLTNEDAIALTVAAQMVAEESGELARDRRIKLGQIIAALAQEFLGTR